MITNDRPSAHKPLIFISAAEPSGDLHGASLIRATREACPTVRFVGVAGPRMVEAGCEPIFDMTRHSAMLLHAVKAAGRAVAMLGTSDRHLRRYPFSAAVVIDSPMLHFPLAARAHALDIPVLYYIVPQLWAWGAYRIHKLRNCVDRAAVILPFEEEYFRNQGVEATYVGHPLAERYAHTTMDRDVVNQIRARGHPLVALLPGSRKQVVRAVLPGQLAVASAVSRAIPQAVFGVSIANPSVAPVISSLLGAENQHGRRSGWGPTRGSIVTYREHFSELITAADLVLVASGTTTLDVAFHQRPMIVMYNSSRWFYHLLGRWMIHTPYLSLPNILAGREIVPEFMPYYTSTKPIADRAVDLLQSKQARRIMTDALSGIIKPLQGKCASRQTAMLLLDMVNRAAAGGSLL